MATEIGRGVIPVGIDKSGLDRGLRGIESSTKSRFAKLGRTALLGFGTAVVGATALAFKFGSAYVSSLNKIQALSNANDATMRRVAKTLEANKGLYAQMGQTTGDAANGVVELVKAGLSLDKSLKAVNATMILAKAGELGVADASALVSNTLNTFGLKARQAGDIANYLANAANLSSADVSDLAESLKFVAPVAADSGVSLRTLSALMAELANAGIKGTNAGTGLRKFLLSLSAPAGIAGKRLEELGVNVFDATGKMKPIQTVIRDLGQALDGLTQGQRAKVMRDIFGLTGITSAQTILKNGVEGLRQYEQGIGRAGAAQALAASASKGLAGTLARLKAITISYAQSAYRVLSPIADRVLTPLVDGFASLGDKGGDAQGFFKSIGAAVKSIYPSVRRFIDQVIGAIGPGLAEIGALVKSDLLPAFKRIIPVLAPVAKVLLTIFGAAVVGVIKGAVNVIKGAIKVISGALNLVVALIHGDWSAAWGSLKQIVSGAVQAVFGLLQVWWYGGILNLFRSAFTLLTKTIWKKGWDLLRTNARFALAAIESAVKSGLAAVGKFFVGAVKGYLNIWRLGFRTVVNLTKSGWQGIRATVSAAVSVVRGLISGLWATVRGLFSRGWDAVKSATSSAWSGIKGAVARGVTNVMTTIRTIPGRALDAVQGFGNLLINAGKQIIIGLIVGIESQLESLKNVLGNVASIIIRNKGPIEKDRRLLIPAGRAIMDGLVEGIGSRRSALLVALGEVTGTLQAALTPAPPVAAAGGGRAASGDFAPGAQVVVHAPQNTDPYQVADIAAGNLAALLKGF